MSRYFTAHRFRVYVFLDTDTRTTSLHPDDFGVEIGRTESNYVEFMRCHECSGLDFSLDTYAQKTSAGIISVPRCPEWQPITLISGVVKRENVALLEGITHRSWRERRYKLQSLKIEICNHSGVTQRTVIVEWPWCESANYTTLKGDSNEVFSESLKFSHNGWYFKDGTDNPRTYYA